nr:ATP-dependent DNA helicase PIF1-like [Ipomoea batatas]
MNVRAPTSFDCLRTVNGKITSSFREAAEKLGLLAGDFVVEESLNEAVLFQMPSSLRLHTNAEAESLVLKMIANIVQQMGKKTKDYCLFDLLESYDFPGRLTNELLHEKNLTVCEADLLAIHQLNVCQRSAFKIITDAVLGNKPSAFFVDGPGGTGKTFLYRCLLAFVRSKGLITLATATSGIAASILPGGRTAHSRFKLPLDGNDKHTADATLLRHSKLILWDEASMAHRNIVESLDTTLKDIMDCQDLFGGKVIVFEGDFRQTLPVVRHGKKEDFIAASLVKSSTIWPHICRLTLVENMRAQTDSTFASYLMKIGNGTEPAIYQNKIKVPSQFLVKKCGSKSLLDALFDAVYPDLHCFFNDPYPMMDRAILTTKNEFVDEINMLLLEKFPGEKKSYISYDEPLDSKYLHCQDYLHTLSPPGLPPHTLSLKKNCPTPVAWVRGKLRMKNIGPIEYYIGCNYCNKAVKDIEGLKLDCLYFGQTDGITVRRYRLNVEISDGSTILQATIFNHDVHRLMLLFGIEMPTTVKESEIFQQKLDSTDFVVGLRKNALNEDQSFSLTYSVACICKAITRDSCVQQQTPHACSSNIVEETFLVGNPTKRRLDLDGSLKHAIDIIEDDTSKQKSASQDKGKRPRVD